MNAFEENCQTTADRLKVEVSFHQDDKYQPPYEDDGFLHVVDQDTFQRAAFDVNPGQLHRRRWQNDFTFKLMKALGLLHLHGVRTKV